MDVHTWDPTHRNTEFGTSRQGHPAAATRAAAHSRGNDRGRSLVCRGKSLVCWRRVGGRSGWWRSSASKPSSRDKFEKHPNFTPRIASRRFQGHPLVDLLVSEHKDLSYSHINCSWNHYSLSNVVNSLGFWQRLFGIYLRYLKEGSQTHRG